MAMIGRRGTKNANTNHLTRIITILEENYPVPQTKYKISKMTGINNLYLIDGLLWLCNHKIIKMLRQYKQKQQKYYVLNKDFKKEEQLKMTKENKEDIDWVELREKVDADIEKEVKEMMKNEA